MRALAGACARVTVPRPGAASSSATPSTATLYDCRGRAAALAGAGRSTT
jgi:hypothetical protein